MVTRAQLLELGLTPVAIKHRVAKGRLHPVRRGVYAVGRPGLTRYGRWMAAVLSCGPGAVLSHSTAAALWEIAGHSGREIEISVAAARGPHAAGLRVHRRAAVALADRTIHDEIPVTSPTQTLIDLATRLQTARLESAVNAADKHQLIDPESLRAALEARPGQPGVAVLRAALDRRTFVLTDFGITPRPHSRQPTGAAIRRTPRRD